VERKKYAPETNTSRTTAVLAQNPGQYGSNRGPSMAQRKPSMTPTMGLRLYQKRHFSGIIELMKPTGLTYMLILTMNGIICFTSRYFTFSALNYRLAPKAAIMAIRKKAGSNSRWIRKLTSYQIMSPIRMTKEIMKSTTAPRVALAGIISLGK